MNHSPEDLVGKKFAKGYALRQVLGSGGQGTVYLGERTSNQQKVAIKVFPPGGADPASFFQEIDTLRRLRHPHIIPLEDEGKFRDSHFFVMPYALNGSLRRTLQSGSPCSPVEAVLYISQAAEGLQYAHDNKVVHRDVKPENLLVKNDFTLWVSDFGLAVPRHRLSSMTTPRYDASQPGTPEYISPEQIWGYPFAEADQYSLAIVAYELLTGKRPFQGDDYHLRRSHIYDTPPPFSDQGVQMNDLLQALEAVVLQALEKKWENRYPTIRDFAQALKGQLTTVGEPPPFQGGQKKIGVGFNAGEAGKDRGNLLRPDLEVEAVSGRKTSQALLQEAERLTQAQFHDQALQCVQEALLIEPQNINALMRKGTLLTLLHQEGEAQKVYEEARRMKEIAAMLATLPKHKAPYIEAYQDAQKELVIDRNNVAALVQQAAALNMLVTDEKPLLSLPLLEDEGWMATLTNRKVSHELTLRALSVLRNSNGYDLGVANDEGTVEIALAHIEEALLLNPKNVDALVLKSRVLRSRSPEEAETARAEAEAIKHDEEEIIKHAREEQDARRSVLFHGFSDPRRYEHSLNLARLALARCDEVLGLNPQNDEALFLKGVAHTSLGQFTSELEQFQDIGKRHARRKSPFLRTFSASDDSWRGREPLMNEADIHIAKGVAYNRLHKFNEALAEFEKAIKATPTYYRFILGDVYFHMGVALSRLWHPQEALQSLLKARELNPALGKGFTYVLDIGLALCAVGKIKEAREIFIDLNLYTGGSLQDEKFFKIVQDIDRETHDADWWMNYAENHPEVALRVPQMPSI